MSLNAIYLTLSGDPVGKRRIRCGCLHGHGHAYDDQKSEMDRLPRTTLLPGANNHFQPRS